MFETVSAAIAILAATFALAQVAVMRRIAHGETIRATFDILYNEEMRFHRRTVYSLADKDVTTWTEGEMIAAERVGSDSSRLGFLIKNGYLRGDDFLEIWTPRLVVTYAILEPYIIKERERFGKDEHWVYFEWLARFAFKQMSGRRAWWHRPNWQKLVAATNGISQINTDAKLKQFLSER